jgi:hypothetical protein
MGVQKYGIKIVLLSPWREISKISGQNGVYEEE